MGRLVDPIGILQRRRKPDSGERLQPLADLLGRELGQIFKLPFQSLALCRKFKVILNRFTQEAWQKSKRQPAQGGKMLGDQLSCLRRILLKLLWLEITWQHNATGALVSAFPGPATEKIPAANR